MLNVSIRSNGRRHHAAGGSGSVANHSWLLLVVVVLRRSGRGGNMLHNGRVQPLLLLLSSVVDLLLLLHRPGRVRCRSGHAGANRRSGAGGGRRVRRESHLRWHSSSCCWRLLRGLIHGLRLRRPGRIRTAAASNACSRSAHIGADRRRGVGGGHGACHLGLVLLRWSRWRRLLLLWSLVLLRTERRRSHHQHQHSQALSSPLLSPPCWMAVALVAADAAVRH